MLASSGSYGAVYYFWRSLREVALLWFVLGLGIARIGRWVSGRFAVSNRFRWLRRSALVCGLFVVCVYLAVTLASLRSFVMQMDEGNILTIAAASLRGQPMYHPPVYPDYSYSLMYGPFTFLIYQVCLLAGGANHFWIIRGAVVLAALGMASSLLFLLRRFVSWASAVALLAFPLSIFLQHTEMMLSARSDIWISLFTTLAIVSSMVAPELAAVLLTGIFGGFIVGLKITAGPAVLYPLLLLYRRFGARYAALSWLLMGAVTLSPFAFPHISLHGYIAWVLFTRTEGLSGVSMTYNLLFAIFLLAPIVLMESFLRRRGLAFRGRIPELLIIIVCLLVAVFTSKHGSGVYYLWHIVPSVVVYMGMVGADMAAGEDPDWVVPVYSIAVASALLAWSYIPRSVGYLRLAEMPPGMAAARQSVNRYLEEYKDRSSVQMGFGSVEGDYRTLLGYVLAYRGEPYTLEGNTGRFETNLVPVPAHVLERMKTCKDDVWLVPHAQSPFSLWVFRAPLRQVFLENYSIEKSDGVYDAWVCDHAKGVAPGR